jgi:biopolymer transport protein TolQ
LLIFSVWSWAVIVERSRYFAAITRRMSIFEKCFWSGDSLETVFNRFSKNNSDPLSTVFCAGVMEWERSQRTDPDRLMNRVTQVMENTLAKEVGALEGRIAGLATIGSIAVYVGLLGTVWGIVNSFRSIAAQKSTSLAIVAPHISEALFATALGLVAAIPAVMAYNRFSTKINNVTRHADIFMKDFVIILSRKLDSR